MNTINNLFKRYIQTCYVLLIIFSSSVQYAQQSPNLLKKEALRHMNAGRYGEAINMLNEFIDQKPDEYEAYYTRGICFEKRSQFKSALTDFRKANNLNPNDAKILKSLHNVENIYKERLDGEILKLEKEFALNSKLHNNFIRLLELYFENGNLDKVKDLNKKFLEENRVNPQLVIRYGEMLAKHNLLNEGELILRKKASEYPNNELINSRHGYFNLWLGNFSRAEKIFSYVLKKNPNLEEAKDGYKQAKAKGYFVPSEKVKSKIQVAGKVNVSKNKIERYKGLLADDPNDFSTRLSMIDELLRKNRLEESFDQLQIVLRDTMNIPRISNYRKHLVNKRDSVSTILLENYTRELSLNPKNKRLVNKIAGHYAELKNLSSAMHVLQNYFNREDVFDGDELRYKYAQYGSWSGNYKDALGELNYLLTVKPDNLEYQLLKAKVLVWDDKNLDLAETYFQNNLSTGNSNLETILPLATLYIKKYNFTDAQKYIDWAKNVDQSNLEIVKVEKLYIEYQKALREKRVYSILESGRKYMSEGDCKNAAIKFEEYFSIIDNPNTSELIEFADAYNCINDFSKANEVYNTILEKEYRTDVAQLRAKNLLWKKNYEEAVEEFQKITKADPDDYESKVFLGEAYQNLKQYSIASNIYNEVLDKSSDAKLINLVNSRMDYLPQTGFAGFFSNFPSPIAFSPSLINYSDNQDFILNDIGGRLEFGIAKIISAGVSYSDINMNSSSEETKFIKFKAHLFVSPFDNVRISGSYGVLNIRELSKKNIGNASIDFKIDNVFSSKIYFERTDAALILYSPFLVNSRHSVDIYKVSGHYQQSKKLRLSGYFSYLEISDGNAGTDFEIRIGTELFDDAYFGYESKNINYKYDSPFVPFTNGGSRLYYSPQNLDAHSLWGEWKLENAKQFDFLIGGQIGYIPLYSTVIREISGRVNYTPFNNFVLSLDLATGSSYRFESSYNFFSGALNFYWKLY